MKIIHIIIISALLILNISGDEIKGDIMIGEWDRSFHAEIHDESVECYLVSIYRAKNVKYRKPMLLINATIVGVVKGKKQIGDKIEYDRVSDGGFKKGIEYEGDLYYIFYHKAPMNGSPIQGEFYIDSQDPGSMVKYTKKRAAIVSAHPHKKK